MLGARTTSEAHRKSVTTAPPLRYMLKHKKANTRKSNENDKIEWSYQASSYRSLTAAITFAPSSKKNTSSTSSSDLHLTITGA